MVITKEQELVSKRSKMNISFLESYIKVKRNYTFNEDKFQIPSS